MLRRWSCTAAIGTLASCPERCLREVAVIPLGWEDTSSQVISREALICIGTSFIRAALLCLLFTEGGWLRAQNKPLMVEEGRYSVHLLLHTIGTETYTVTQTAPGRQVMTTTSTTSDRGMKRTSSTKLEMGALFAPVVLEQRSSSGSSGHSGGSGEDVSLTEVKGSSVSILERGVGRTMRRPPVAFVGFGTMPASVQMMMMRYWRVHHQPARLPILRASEKALPLEIKLVGHDSFAVEGRMVRLTRYTVANLMFGREIVWMNDSGRLAALMTFAGGLPQEEILEGYEPVEADLEHSGVQQEMLDLDDLDRKVPAEAAGAFAIVGARLIDGTGSPAVDNSVVMVRGGRIVAAGKMGTVNVPPGMRVIHAEGRPLLPGLWEMHSHYSGVGFGPALLAAGATTARGWRGEVEVL